MQKTRNMPKEMEQVIYSGIGRRKGNIHSQSIIFVAIDDILPICESSTRQFIQRRTVQCFIKAANCTILHIFRGCKFSEMSQHKSCAIHLLVVLFHF